jgi:ATP-dependent DNA helicase RecG
MTLDTPVTQLPIVRGRVAQGLERLQVRTVRHLLFHFPSRHEDRRTVTAIRNVIAATPTVVRGVVKAISTEAVFRRHGGRTRRMLLTHAVVADDSGELPVIWFHQRFIEKQFPVGTPVYLFGTVTFGNRGLTLVAPDIERVQEGKPPIHTGRLVPVYPETAGVTSRLIRFLVHRALPLTEHLKEYLPAETYEAEHLGSIADAVRMIHFPDTIEELERARQRLAFDELFLLQLAALVRKRSRAAQHPVPLSFADDIVADAVPSLPFP